MLDDLAYIHERDVEDALGIVEKQGQQLAQAFSLSGATAFQPIQNIVYAGMGGSALAALLAQTWPPVTVPFQVVRDYDLPHYVNERTLVICASYSGNTEETLSALAQAEQKGSQIVIITGGGKLKEAAQTKNYPLLELPKTAQPRYAVLANFKALLVTLEKSGVVAAKDFVQTVEAAGSFLNREVAAWRPDVAVKDNLAKQIAQELIGKSVVVYAGPHLYPAAYKWKISVNENAKQVAWLNQIPEFNHNEFIGWSKQPTDKPYTVVDLRSSFEHPRVQKRFEVSARLLSGMRPEPITVQAKGDTVLEQVLWTSALGDFVSIYLALLNGLNPAPVDLVEKFKVALDS
ncbi:MAG: glucose/mannose-6-phosphate isomerase [Patescibacteria group bacterium]|nr:glucose/mannose-6-phosphate isomerase [Patescibacteria group bacterium]